MARGVGEVTGDAAIGVVGGTGLALLVTAALFWWLARRLRRQVAVERASLGEQSLQLVDGMAALAGTVEVDDDGGPPVTVTVEERRKSTDWRVAAQVVAARPFVLRLANGTGVRVDPGADPVLRDALEAEEMIDRDHRRRVARLSPGEQVFVRGQLRVRGLGTSAALVGSERVVLGRPRRRPMLLSTEALGGALERRAGEHQFRMVMLLVTWGVGALLYIDTYVAGVRYLLAGGEPPGILFDIYFWVMLISGSVILGAVGSAWTERPWWRGGSG